METETHTLKNISSEFNKVLLSNVSTVRGIFSKYMCHRWSFVFHNTWNDFQKIKFHYGTSFELHCLFVGQERKSWNEMQVMSSGMELSWLIILELYFILF